MLARIEAADGVPRGVLVRLDAPLAAFVHPLAWRWLHGGILTEEELPAESRAACEKAWAAAGLVVSGTASERRAATITWCYSRAAG